MDGDNILSEFQEWANNTDDETDDTCSTFADGVAAGRYEGGQKLLELLEAWLLNHPTATKEQILDFLDTQVGN